MTACCPGGTSSNIFTYFSNSDITLSLVATGLSNILATLVLPILIPFWSQFFVPAEGAIPMTSILTSVALVLVPCTFGIIVKCNSDVWSKRLEKVAGGAGSFSILFTIVVGAVARWEYFLTSWKLYAAGLTMMPIGGILGYNLGKCCGLPQKTIQAICYESGLQNALIALTIMEFSFEPTDPVFLEAQVFCYLYLFMIFIPHGFVMLFYFRRCIPAELLEEEATEDAELAAKS